MKVDYICHSGNDLLVVNAARVSFDKQKNELDDQDIKLLHYLAEHGHLSPFFHPTVTLRVHAPIFVARQLTRSHVGFSISEVSRRYIKTEPEFFQPESWRQKPDHAKQGSGEAASPELNRELNSAYSIFKAMALDLYKAMLEDGIAPEQARMVLPQSMYTTWLWTGSLYGWFRVYKLRTEHSAQQETRHIGWRIGKVISELYPHSWRALAAA